MAAVAMVCRPKASASEPCRIPARPGLTTVTKLMIPLASPRRPCGATSSVYACRPVQWNPSASPATGATARNQTALGAAATTATNSAIPNVPAA